MKKTFRLGSRSNEHDAQEPPADDLKESGRVNNRRVRFSAWATRAAESQVQRVYEKTGIDLVALVEVGRQRVGVFRNRIDPRLPRPQLTVYVFAPDTDGEDQPSPPEVVSQHPLTPNGVRLGAALADGEADEPPPDIALQTLEPGTGQFVDFRAVTAGEEVEVVDATDDGVFIDISPD